MFGSTTKKKTPVLVVVSCLSHANSHVGFHVAAPVLASHGHAIDVNSLGGSPKVEGGVSFWGV